MAMALIAADTCCSGTTGAETVRRSSPTKKASENGRTLDDFRDSAAAQQLQRQTSEAEHVPFRFQMEDSAGPSGVLDRPGTAWYPANIVAASNQLSSLTQLQNSYKVAQTVTSTRLSEILLCPKMIGLLVESVRACVSARACAYLIFIPVRTRLTYAPSLCLCVLT